MSFSLEMSGGRKWPICGLTARGRRALARVGLDMSTQPRGPTCRGSPGEQRKDAGGEEALLGIKRPYACSHPNTPSFAGLLETLSGICPTCFQIQKSHGFARFSGEGQAWDAREEAGSRARPQIQAPLLACRARGGTPAAHQAGGQNWQSPNRGNRGTRRPPSCFTEPSPPCASHFTDKTTKAKGRQGVRQARPSGPGCWGS